MRVGRTEAKGCQELVMDLVDALIERFDVEHAMSPIFEEILANEKENHLPRKLEHRWPRTVMLQAQQIKHRPTCNNHRDDHNHVVEHDIQDTAQIIIVRIQLALLDLVLVHPTHLFHHNEDST